MFFSTGINYLAKSTLVFFIYNPCILIRPSSANSPSGGSTMRQGNHASVNAENLPDLISSNELGTFFGVSQKILDNVWNNLCAPAGNSVIYISMEIGADMDVYNPVKDKLEASGLTESTEPLLDLFIKRFNKGPTKIPNYSGGLGILAGDTLKSMADCRIPAVAISLLYKKGYFSQFVDHQVGQIAWATEWKPEQTPGLYLLKNHQYPSRPLRIEIPFFDNNDEAVLAYADLWLKMEINNNLDFFVPEILLDYSIEDSPQWIREAAGRLYDSSSDRVKALQRRMLGAAIVPVTELLGLTAKTIHLNEQHGVIVVLHLIAHYLLNKLGDKYQTVATDADIKNAVNEVAKHVAYTIHTPVKAGHDRFDRLTYGGLSHSFCQRLLDLLAKDTDDQEYYNFTALAMKVNRSTNSVSRLHRDVTKKQFPQYAEKITAITNGVHHLTWISRNKAAVFDRYEALASWRDDPSVFANAGSLLKETGFRTDVERAWSKDTEDLINFVNHMLSRHRQQMVETWIDPANFFSYINEKEANLSPEAFTIGFARRFSTYKRADLIFEDIDTLAAIIREHNRPINFLFAGKAHPADEPGKSVIKLILDIQKDLYFKSKGLAKLVFISDYDMAIAKLMVAGVHAWLNNPKRPLEASGTSGMKAAMNAVPNISIMDGWWVEGYHNGSTGWKFGYEGPIDMDHLREDQSSLLYAEDSASFYQLFPTIIESFYNPELHSDYVDKCIMNLMLNIPIFNTHRMVAEYTTKYDITLPPQIAERISRFSKLYQSEADETAT
jgi:starch phosphorylase